MDWLHNLIFGNSAAQTIFVLSLVIFIGVLIGKINVKGVSISIGGVLFSGLLFGHFKLHINHEVLDFVREFGLVLFVYTIGIQVGPAFFASFKKQGLSLNMLASGIVFLNVSTAIAILFITGLPVAVVVGILSGAVTNTPGLGAAQQALQEVMPNSPGMYQMPGLGYAMAYPFGIIGIILTMLLCRRIFKIDLKKEAAKFNEERSSNSGTPEERSLIVTNPRVVGKTVGKIKSLIQDDFVVSQLFREGGATVPDENVELKTGDIIQVVCTKDQFDDLAMLVGDISEHNFKDLTSDLSFRSIVATQKDALKKTIAQLEFPSRLGVNITKIERAGVEFMPRPSMKLCFGDNVIAVGSKEALDKASDELGNSEKDLAHPNIMPIFIGIFIGIIVGCIPVSIPGLSAPVKLGIAGGPLLIAVILGRIRRIGPLNWHLPMGANLMLREVGITLFLACVGLKSGGSFIHTIMDGEGIHWMFLGMIITALPLFTIALIARYMFKKNYLSICGLLAGSCTDPPALSFAYQMSESEAPVVSYATVYALTMFLRIITAQLFVIIFSSF